MGGAHFEVVGIVGGSHFHRARSERGVHVIVGEYGKASPDDWKDSVPSDQASVPLVVGIHRDPRIAQHRLGPGCRHLDILLRVFQGIADIPEKRVDFLVLYFDIGYYRVASGAEVHHVVSFVDEPLLVKAHKHLGYGLRATFVHGEPLPGPITRRAQGFHLVRYDVAVLVLPLPGSSQELLSPQFPPGGAFGLEHFLDPGMRGYGGVVGSRKPEGLSSGHPHVADDDVLKREIQGVSYMKRPGNVGRGHDQGESGLLRTRLGFEKAVVRPKAVPFLLKRFRFVRFWHLRKHRESPQPRYGYGPFTTRAKGPRSRYHLVSGRESRRETSADKFDRGGLLRLALPALLAVTWRFTRERFRSRPQGRPSAASSRRAPTTRPAL